MAATAPSDVSDGPVLSLINKRLRALRKKHNRILQMEEAISQGKPINKEQEDVLRSKPSVTALIDELEKLRQPLSSAVSEEINLAVQRQQASVSSQPVVTDDSPSEVTDDKPSGEKDQSEHAVVEDLLNLLYFGSLFDVKSQSDFTSTMLTRTHERSCCITYDYVTDDATDLLAERDLDLISTMSGLLVSRPVDSNLPHKNALERCIEHAKLWLTKADQPIEPNTDVTYANLRERLHKIMASDYFTTTPEIKGPVEVAAVAAGNYANFQVPVAVHEEESDEKFQHTDVDVGDLQGDDISDGQPGSVDEMPRDVQETGNSSELVTQQEVAVELVAEEDILMVVEVEATEGEEDPTRMDAADIMTSQETIIRGTTTMVEEEVGGAVANLTTVMVQPKALLTLTLTLLAWLCDDGIDMSSGCFSEVVLVLMDPMEPVYKRADIAKPFDPKLFCGHELLMFRRVR
ncbi:hypothetical protein SDJN03_06635, partial [Cucurbita argyrosperma subsp. sororia]